MPRDVSLSDRKCWNGGHEWVKVKKLMKVPFDNAAELHNAGMAVSQHYDGNFSALWRPN